MIAYLDKSYSSFGMKRGSSFRDDTGSVMAGSVMSEKCMYLNFCDWPT